MTDPTAMIYDHTHPCDMERACKAPVTHVDRKGYVYCTAHAAQRTSYCACHPIPAPRWHAVGPVRGPCGHAHRTVEAAERCAAADATACARLPGGTAYSDRRAARCAATAATRAPAPAPTVDRYAGMASGDVWERVVGIESPRAWVIADVDPYLDGADSCADFTAAERATVARCMRLYIAYAS
jgi:hypothetical protein